MILKATPFSSSRSLRLLFSLALPIISISLFKIPDLQAQGTPAATATAIPAPPLFPDAERASVVNYWNQPERYVQGVRAGEKDGPLVVRLMPEASVWLRAYNNAPRPGQKTTLEKRATPLTDTTQSKVWEKWVQARLDYDRWLAQKTADAANAQLGVAAPTAAAPAAAVTSPPFPGVIPADLLAAVGNPPQMYDAVLPRRYTVTFDDGQVFKYTDNIALANSRNPSYRFAQGVISMGTRLRDWPQKDLDELFSQVGLTPFEQNVVKAVSVLEGGFDSINTYDTGFVSVGFIQFASLADGSGSLGDVLKRQKQLFPAEYEKDFRRFGVDVDPNGVLVVLDPNSGAELRGALANLEIINDKRLIATFHRAGRTRAFQIAQIQVAKQNYYPANTNVTVTIDGKQQQVRAGDVIRSEAGMATLFDRKVNAGNIRILGEVLTQFIKERGFTSVEQVLPHERELVAKLKWRTDFLADKSLGQP